jgi:hypothetical protein
MWRDRYKVHSAADVFPMMSALDAAASSFGQASSILFEAQAQAAKRGRG